MLEHFLRPYDVVRRTAEVCFMPVTVGGGVRTAEDARALLLAGVVLKLLLVDLGHTSALQRVVSFLGVGVLMLVIGYVAPLPPALPPRVLTWVLIAR